MKNYSVTHLSEANWIMKTKKELNHRKCDIWWAAKVIKWFKSIHTLAKLYHRSLSSYALCIKAVWQSMKKLGKSASELIKSYLRKAVDFVVLTYDYKKEKVQRMKIRGKYKQRAKLQRKTDYLQSHV